MSARLVPIHNANVAVLEAGEGAPLVYLHGFADIHACMGELQPFHLALAKRRRVVAPALPGVNGFCWLSGGVQPDSQTRSNVAR